MGQLTTQFVVLAFLIPLKIYLHLQRIITTYNIFLIFNLKKWRKFTWYEAI